jgi:hypothetical protein
MGPSRYPVRNTLIAALSACVDDILRTRTRRFLSGLSADELLFIAEFLGACIVECSADVTRAAPAVQAHDARMARASLRRGDHEHKMILVREFLWRSGRELPTSTARV